MRVNLSSLYAGPRGSWGPGLCDVPEDIGNELIESGAAILIGVEVRGDVVAADASQPADEDGSVSEEEQAFSEDVDAGKSAGAPVRRGARRGRG